MCIFKENWLFFNNQHIHFEIKETTGSFSQM